MAQSRSARPGQAAAPPPRLTGRGAVLTMAGIFLVGLLAANLFGWPMLAGLAFVAGCVLAARYTASADLLTVVISPPLLFVGLMVLVSAVTGPGSLVLSVVVGSVATLTGAALWLAVGMAVTIVIAWARGLPRCIRDLRRELARGRASRRAGRAGRSDVRAGGAARTADRSARPGVPAPDRSGRSGAPAADRSARLTARAADRVSG